MNVCVKYQVHVTDLPTEVSYNAKRHHVAVGGLDYDPDRKRLVVEL